MACNETLRTMQKEQVAAVKKQLEARMSRLRNENVCPYNTNFTLIQSSLFPLEYVKAPCNTNLHLQIKHLFGTNNNHRLMPYVILILFIHVVVQVILMSDIVEYYISFNINVYGLTWIVQNLLRIEVFIYKII